MAKKKKTQLKPVARGFATISVPKKAALAEEAEGTEPARPANTPQDGILSGENAKNENIRAEQNATQADGFDPGKAGEQSLQDLVDRLQEKTEKEIMRTIKIIETDRSFSRTLPRLELDPLLRDHILALAEESFHGEGKTLDEPEDKALSRLAITYGVLRRLGFSEKRVGDCLRAINGVDIEEAYDWLFTFCSENELSVNGDPQVPEARTPRTPVKNSSQLPEAPRTPTQFLASNNPTPKVKTDPTSKLDANAPLFLPTKNLSPTSHFEHPASAADVPPPNSKSTISTSGSSQCDEDSDCDDPTVQYVRLKIEYELMLGNRAKYTNSQVEVARSQLADLEKDLLFDERAAVQLYQKERSKVLLERLRRPVPSPSPPADPVQLQTAKKTPPGIQITSVPTPISSSSSDIFDDVASDGSGGLFELLEEAPLETSPDGVVITLKDMAPPKHWAGRTPKVLLKEAVARADRYAVITYNLISGLSRTKRASVRIRWEGKKSDEWSMVDVACVDQVQAEHYIALTALHALSFPPTEGFASGPGGTSNLTFFRLLPPTFRDLWDGLEEARKSREDSINRQAWAKLCSIVESKIDSNSKANERYSRANTDKRDVVSVNLQSRNADATPQQLISTYQMLQANPSYQEMLVQRRNLPIAQYRDRIIKMLECSQILVLSGETGCGKSTQVPNFILEDQLSKGKPCRIYCTEPRRISAISLAQRVSRELGEPPNAVGTLNSLVGYAIRLESNVTRNTRLAYVTNGIALRMLEGRTGQGGEGTGFDEFTHIIIDEVHERTIESDFLLIILKTLLEQRSDLKVILMSATIEAEKISQYFGGCPTLHVPGRTFPVDVCYLEDAVEYTNWSITESSPYARRLHDKFYRGKNQYDWSEEIAAVDDDDVEDNARDIKLEKRYSPETVATLNLFDERLIPHELVLRLLEKLCFEDPSYQSYSAAILIFVPGLGEIRRLNDMLNDHPRFGADELFRIYPLHSTLSSENQSSVFEIPPPGARKIVIATNIAETGITIPDITCVIDTGKHREMRFDEKRQISRLVETFIAKSNAAQRRGRAGRVQQGLCFHLFTKVRHDNQMADNPLPEMVRLSLSDLALRIKIMRINLGSSIEDVLSRALDPPVAVNVQRAIATLVEARALTPTEEITPMGRLLSKLPTDVHIGKFLLIATLFRCLDPALTIAAALNSKSPFVTPFGLEAEAERAKASFRTENSDFLTIHSAFDSWRKASANHGFVHKFCRTNYLSYQNMQQIEELRQQFLGYLVDSSFVQVERSVVRELNRARWSRGKSKFVVVPAELDANSSNPSIVNAALVAGLYPKVLAFDSTKLELRTITNNQAVWLHPSSVNFNRKLSDMGCNHFAYFTLMHSKKLYAWETGPVDDLALLLLCGDSEFKVIADMATIDRNKVRFNIPPKSNIALKFLRAHMGDILAQRFRNRSLDGPQVRWKELGMLVLGRVKPREDDAASINLRV